MKNVIYDDMFKKYQDVVSEQHKKQNNVYDRYYQMYTDSLAMDARDNSLRIDDYRRVANESALKSANKTNSILADYGLAKSAYGAPTSGYGEQSRLNQSINLQNIQSQLNTEEKAAVEALQKAYADADRQRMNDKSSMNFDYMQAYRDAAAQDNERMNALKNNMDYNAATGKDMNDYEKRLYELYYGEGSYQSGLDTAVKNAITNGQITDISQLDRYKGTEQYDKYLSDYIRTQGTSDDIFAKIDLSGEKTKYSSAIKDAFLQDLATTETLADIDALYEAMKVKKSYLNEADYKDFQRQIENKYISLNGDYYKSPSDKAYKVVDQSNSETVKNTSLTVGEKIAIKYFDGSENNDIYISSYATNAHAAEMDKAGVKPGQIYKCSNGRYYLRGKNAYFLLSKAVDGQMFG